VNIHAGGLWGSLSDRFVRIIGDIAVGSWTNIGFHRGDSSIDVLAGESADQLRGFSEFRLFSGLSSDFLGSLVLYAISLLRLLDYLCRLADIKQR